MNPAEKALWFIESHLARELTLDEIAEIAGISRFHMVRSFAAATGLSVMRYDRTGPKNAIESNDLKNLSVKVSVISSI